jgi:hypothetical protein
VRDARLRIGRQLRELGEGSEEEREIEEKAQEERVKVLKTTSVSG